MFGVSGDKKISFGFPGAFQKSIVLRIDFDNFQTEPGRHPPGLCFQPGQKTLNLLWVKTFEFGAPQDFRVFFENRFAEAQNRLLLKNQRNDKLGRAIGFQKRRDKNIGVKNYFEHRKG